MKTLSAFFGALVALAATSGVFGAPGCVTPPSGLAGWWPGDGNANDIAGTNNGTLQGGATATAAGMIAQAFSFDGTNAYVQIPNNAALQPTNLTIEAWVRFSSLDSAGSGGSPAGDQYIVFKQNSQTWNFEGFDLSKTRVAGGDVFRFLVTSATAQSAEIHSATLVTTGIWYHVAAVRGSNFTQLYVNGQLERQTNVAFAQNYGSLPLYF
ncbi:MAG: LamG domain-containing protein, partial [Verrucomicrobiota bacterium]